MELQVLGRRLIIDVDDGTVLQWITEYWDFPATARALDADFTIEVTAGGSSAAPDPTFDDSDGIVTLTLTRTGAAIGIAGAPFRAWSQLYRAIAEAMSASGVILLHAAVITRGDRTMVLCAPSGVGKSTTATLLRRCHRRRQRFGEPHLVGQIGEQSGARMIHDPGAITSDLDRWSTTITLHHGSALLSADLLFSTNTSFPHQKGDFADAPTSIPSHY